MKSFYPHQQMNIFTNNNWILSDECIKIFQSNNFYAQHVRWDVERFRPSDVSKEANIDNGEEQPLAQISSSLPCENTGGISQVSSQQTHMDAAQEKEIISVLPMTTRPKRKVTAIENQENEVRTQPGRAKKK
jgi:hypothetical protein